MTLGQINLSYRTWFKGAPPKKIKLEVPGWAGETGFLQGQPWHCKPFVDGMTYGCELLYPFDTEVTVTTKNGELEWTGDFEKERMEIAHSWNRPFHAFAPGHFGFTSSVDLKTDANIGTMILPHPRYYTDRTGTVPLAVQGLIESHWWPRIFFVVFKSPLEGQTYVFKKGDGYAQLMFVPLNPEYAIRPMTPDEERERKRQDEILQTHPKLIATRTWETQDKLTFDNKYKRLSSIARHSGAKGVMKTIDNALTKSIEDANEKISKARNKFKRKIIHRNDRSKT